MAGEKDKVELETVEEELQEAELEECLDDSIAKKGLEFYHLSWIGAGALIIFIIALWLSPSYFDYIKDPDALYRWGLIKFPQAVLTIFTLLGSACLANLVFPGEILRRVLHEPIACAIVLGSLFLSVGLTLM